MCADTIRIRLELKRDQTSLPSSYLYSVLFLASSALADSADPDMSVHSSSTQTSSRDQG